jgi:amino acid transporter
VAIAFTTAIAFGLILYVTAFANDSAISTLGGTTSLLLLAVFAVVNIAVLMLRKDIQADGAHFETPTWLPWVGFVVPGSRTWRSWRPSPSRRASPAAP